MQLAIDLSRRGLGTTSPNPVVGSVVVREGVVVGSGYHARAGEPHAEVLALKAAGSKAKGATVYVTLEPCCVYGRTPPCTSALIAAGVSRVVVAVRDPNPQVSGKGIEILKQAGLEVVEGVEEKEAAFVNRHYLVWRRKGRPYLTLKAAVTLDGKIADAAGSSKWLTSEAARADAQELRRLHDAVLVGCGTFLADNPRLTYRGPGPKHPPLRRYVYCPSGKHLSLIEEKGFLALTGELKQVFKELAAADVTSVLVEGGARLFSMLLAAGLYDELVLYFAPRLFGGGLPLVSLERPFLLADEQKLRLHEIKAIDDCVRVNYLVEEEEN